MSISGGMGAGVPLLILSPPLQPPPFQGFGHIEKDFRAAAGTFGIDAEHAAHGIGKGAALGHEYDFFEELMALQVVNDRFDLLTGQVDVGFPQIDQEIDRQVKRGIRLDSIPSGEEIMGGDFALGLEHQHIIFNEVGNRHKV